MKAGHDRPFEVQYTFLNWAADLDTVDMMFFEFINLV